MTDFETTRTTNSDGTEVQVLTREKVVYRLLWIMRGASGYAMKSGSFSTADEALAAKADPFFNAPADARVIKSTTTETIRIEEEFVNI